MTAGTWTTTRGGKRAVPLRVWAVGAALVVAIVLAWPVLVLLTKAAITVVLAVWAAVYYVLAYEALVAVVAFLDWRDATLNVDSYRRAFLVAHGTLWARAGRRARWAVGMVPVAVAQWRKPTTPPEPPARLRVVTTTPTVEGEVRAA